MIPRSLYECARQLSLSYIMQAGITLTHEEESRLEVADFGLDDLMTTGLELLTYVNTSRVCAKELVLFPSQTCPEHTHPSKAGLAGKEETFRCRFGTVYLYTSGNPSGAPHCRPPEGRYTVFFETVLRPGQQFTILPNTQHWFQSGDEGAVVSEFSTHSDDESDIFTDPRIVRVPVIRE